MIFVFQNDSSKLCCPPEGKFLALAFLTAVGALKSNPGLGDSREQPTPTLSTQNPSNIIHTSEANPLVSRINKTIWD